MIPKEKTKTEEIESKMIDLSRVERMTAGGRRLRFQATVVVGDKKGKVGVAVAKSSDVTQAIEKATKQGKKRMIEVPIVDETIPHQVEGKFSSSQVFLRPQKKGRGLIAGGTTRVICDLAGIGNISAKNISRTGNKLNNAKATIEALKKLKKSKKSEIINSEQEKNANSSNKTNN